MPAATARDPGILMAQMLPGDLDAVLAIENKSFNHAVDRYDVPV